MRVEEAQPRPALVDVEVPCFNLHVLATPTLKGREVVLRPLQIDDADSLALASSESRESYRFSWAPDGLTATRAWIETALAEQQNGFRMPFTVLWNERIVGSTSYSELLPWKWPAGSPQVRTQAPDAVEIGFTWYAASAQRTRVNSEAKFLLLSHAFEVWCVHSVCWRTDERNERSRRAIERLGAKLDGIRRAHCAGADGTVRSSAFYSIIAAEWPALRREHIERLER